MLSMTVVSQKECRKVLPHPSDTWTVVWEEAIHLQGEAAQQR